MSFWVASPSLPLRIYGRNGKVGSDAGIYVHVHVTILTSTKLSSEIIDSNATHFLFQQSVFLLHNEEERENWISAIKKLQPKGKSL